MVVEERHCGCPDINCNSEKTFRAINFISHLRAENYDNCRSLLTQDNTLSLRMVWESMSCEGGYGMPLWKYFGYLLQEEPIFSTRIGFKEIALLIIEQAGTSPESKAILKIRFALTSDQHESSCWDDVLQQEIRKGVLPFEDKDKFLPPRTPKMLAIWENWINLSEECCICLDSQPDAYFSSCAHKEFCFNCARDLTHCPICRAPGYAKKH